MKSQLLLHVLQIWLTVMTLVPGLEVEVVEANEPPIAKPKPGCQDTCGNVSIPFPFGIGPGCFLGDWYEMECISNGTMFKPLLAKLKFEVMEITTVSTDSQTLTVGMPPLTACAAQTQLQLQTSLDLRKTPFSFSLDDHVFITEGCPGNAILLDDYQTVLGGCGTVCSNDNPAIPANSCYGVRCCQTPLTNAYSSSTKRLYIEFNSLASSSATRDCLVATIIKSDSVNQYVGKLSSSDPSSAAAPVVLSWEWISPVQADNSSHSICTRYEDSLTCDCTGNYYGNAYVSNGCQVPEQCKGCRGRCGLLLAGGGGVIPHAYHCYDQPLQLAAILGLSISFGIVLSVVGLYGLYRFIKRRREIRRRAKFFKRNGGLLLQQQLASNEGILAKTKIFTVNELDKATDSFNENRILGQGGQGTVYKGMLNDGRIVAVKKAKLLDESQLEQFTNEVVILSQINHRNVVKMLGCCLETEVPLLVYEFIPNGTLSQHIHDPDEDSVISWDMRLKIAADSAAAVAYLHSSSSIPIYHRDIKSSNILLDEKNIAKVSDFGSSRTIAIDQTHLTTLVQGTMGYLDPEYFQSYQFTEKSDVYSFGVVLLEILTGKKPIYRDKNMEQKNLVTEFLFLTHQTSGFPNILDPEIMKQAKEEELVVVVELAKCCTSWSGKQRPTMKEVAMTLEMIIKSPAQAIAWYQQQEGFPVPHEGFAENAITSANDAEFISNPLPARVIGAMFIDVNPLLPDTI